MADAQPGETYIAVSTTGTIPGWEDKTVESSWLVWSHSGLDDPATAIAQMQKLAHDNGFDALVGVRIEISAPGPHVSFHSYYAYGTAIRYKV